MAAPRTPGRVLAPLLATGLLLAACRSAPTAPPDDTSAVRAGAAESLASVRAVRASHIPRCQQNRLRLCADPLAALPEQPPRRGDDASESEDAEPDAKAPRSPAPCESGKARECHAIASLREHEDGLRAALPSFIEACHMGFASSCERLARAFKDSPSPAASACALAFHGQACQLGAGDACVQQASALFQAEGPAFDIACGNAALEKACELGTSSACAELPGVLRWSQRRALDAEALRWAERACAGGVAASCTDVARRHETGRGVPVDLAKALRLHEEACDLGAPTACMEAGLLLSEQAQSPEEKRYAEVRLAHGLERTELRSGSSSPLAALKLALAYEEGAEVARAPARTRRLLERLEALCRPVSEAERKAAEALEVGPLRERQTGALRRASTACLEVGLAREAGIGGAMDAEAARRFLARSCGESTTGCLLHWSALLREQAPAGEQARARERLESWKESLLRQAEELLQLSRRLAPPALRIIDVACRVGAEESCVSRARVTAQFGGGPASEGGLTELESLCFSGQPAACEHSLRVLASDAPGLKRSDARLAEMSRAACAGGIATACVRLAGLQEEGRAPVEGGTPTTALYQQHCAAELKGCWRPALRWLEQAPAERGKALTWLQHQCNLGERQACAALGTLFLEGRHVLQDGYIAADYLSRACVHEDGASCARLAGLLERHGGAEHAADAAWAHTQACRLQALSCGEAPQAEGQTR